MRPLCGQVGRVTGTNLDATREPAEPIDPLNAGGESINEVSQDGFQSELHPEAGNGV